MNPFSRRVSLILWICMLTTGLLACQSSDTPRVETAKKLMSNVLKDPVSAQYRNIYVESFPKEIIKKTNISWAVCGEVNSKNSFGAYTGFKRFVVNEKSSSPLYEGAMVSKWDKEAFELIYQGCSSSAFSKEWK